MRFYLGEHRHYCGIDLHARTMYLCIVNSHGKVLLHRNMPARPEAFLAAIERFRDGLVVAAECMFTWYWIADLCAEHQIPFILGHALYIKAVHGGKVKNDRVDSKKLALLLRAGLFPMAYVYPSSMRPTRDLLRRRLHFSRKRAELNVHIQHSNAQYNLPPMPGKLGVKKHRLEVVQRFTNPDVRRNVELDLALMDTYDLLLLRLERHILKTAKVHDPDAVEALLSVPGIGRILAMTILYEVCDINRFPRVQDFVSYCRLVKPQKESAGKIYGHNSKKIGNANLRWAFGEAATLFLRQNPEAQAYHARLKRKHGRGKALAVLAHKLGRAVYFILKRKRRFDMDKFLGNG
jgi:transposase